MSIDRTDQALEAFSQIVENLPPEPNRGASDDARTSFLRELDHFYDELDLTVKNDPEFHEAALSISALAINGIPDELMNAKMIQLAKMSPMAFEFARDGLIPAAYAPDDEIPYRREIRAAIGTVLAKEMEGKNFEERQNILYGALTSNPMQDALVPVALKAIGALAHAPSDMEWHEEFRHEVFGEAAFIESCGLHRADWSCGLRPDVGLEDDIIRIRMEGQTMNDILWSWEYGAPDKELSTLMVMPSLQDGQWEPLTPELVLALSRNDREALERIFNATCDMSLRIDNIAIAYGQEYGEIVAGEILYEQENHLVNSNMTPEDISEYVKNFTSDSTVFMSEDDKIDTLFSLSQTIGIDPDSLKGPSGEKCLDIVYTTAVETAVNSIQATINEKRQDQEMAI